MIKKIEYQTQTFKAPSILIGLNEAVETMLLSKREISFE